MRWAVLLGLLGAAVLEYSFALSPRASEIVVAQVSGANATQTILDTSPSFLASPSFLETSPSIPQTPPSVWEATPSFLESEQKRQPPQLLQAGLNLPSKVSQECLKFIHIPKNAGSTVYEEAEKYKYGWSVDDHTLKCLRGEKCTNYGFTRPCCRPKQSKDRCSIWHFPPAEDSVLAERYARCKTFCIVRNPLGRFISEYKWHILRWSKGSKKSHKRQELICSPAALENYFEEVKRGGRLNFAADCHLLPQVKYVFSNDLQRLHCNHVLRFENLTSEFNAIMKAYRLAIRLEDGNEDLHKHYYAIPCKITLTEEMKSWIYETYRQDFELFGYSMA